MLLQAGRGVDDLVTRDDDLALQQDGPPLAILVQLGADGGLGGVGGRGMLGIHHAEFQGRGGAEDLLGARRILHTGQLDDDAILALLLNHGFRHAQLVDTVAQGRDILRDGKPPDFADFCVAHARNQRIALLAEDQAPHLPLQRGFRLPQTAGVIELHLDRMIIAVHRGILDLGVAQQGTHVFRVAFLRLLDRGFHVDLHHEMHATPEVETEVHGRRVDAAQPGGCGRREIERHRVMLAQGILEQVGSLELSFRITEADQQALFTHFQGLGFQPRIGQEFFGLRDQFLIQGSAARGRQLHGRILTEEIGQGVDHRQAEDEDDEDVFPERKLITHVDCL